VDSSLGGHYASPIVPMSTFNLRVRTLIHISTVLSPKLGSNNRFAAYRNADRTDQDRVHS
jgi:hypothetical protein